MYLSTKTPSFNSSRRRTLGSNFFWRNIIFYWLFDWNYFFDFHTILLSMKHMNNLWLWFAFPCTIAMHFKGGVSLVFCHIIVGTGTNWYWYWSGWFLYHFSQYIVNYNIKVNHTANVCRDLQGLSWEIGVWGFQITGIACTPTIPVIF